MTTSAEINASLWRSPDLLLPWGGQTSAEVGSQGIRLGCCRCMATGQPSPLRGEPETLLDATSGGAGFPLPDAGRG